MRRLLCLCLFFIFIFKKNHYLRALIERRISRTSQGVFSGSTRCARRCLEGCERSLLGPWRLAFASIRRGVQLRGSLMHRVGLIRLRGYNATDRWLVDAFTSQGAAWIDPDSVGQITLVPSCWPTLAEYRSRRCILCDLNEVCKFVDASTDILAQRNLSMGLEVWMEP